MVRNERLSSSEMGYALKGKCLIIGGEFLPYVSTPIQKRGEAENDRVAAPDSECEKYNNKTEQNNSRIGVGIVP